MSAENFILTEVRYLLGTPDGVNIAQQAKEAGHALRQLAEVEKLLARLVFECELDMKGYRALVKAQDYLVRRKPPVMRVPPTTAPLNPSCAVETRAS